MQNLHARLVDNEDIAFKLDCVHQRLRVHIDRAKKSGDIPSKVIDPVKYAEESGASKWAAGNAHPVSFQKLLDIKHLFELRRHDGFVGFSEQEFISQLAPIFCESQDSNFVMRWFMMIDQDANGYVDWDEFSQYIMQSAHIGDTRAGPAKRYCNVPVAPDYPCTNPIFVTKFAHNANNDVYYCAATDGSVKCWDAKTLELKSTVHYPDNISIVDLKYCGLTNRLLVLQQDKTVWLYDCGGVTLRQGHRLIRGFKLESMDLNLREKCASNFSQQYSKTVEFDPTKMALSHTSLSMTQQSKPKKKRTVKTAIDITLLDNVADMSVKHCHCKTQTIDAVQAAEFGRGLFPSASYATGTDYYILGTADGHMGLFDYSRIGCVLRPVALWEPHTAFISQMMATNTNPQLQGIISSSFDRTVQVLDVEKGQTYLRLEVDEKVSECGGRGVRGFDYAPTRNLLVTIGFNRNVLMWDPLARRHIATLSDHKRPIVDATFCEERNQLVTMSEDKVVKIWDLRSFLCMQTLVDKERRYPEDRFTTATYDHTHQTIVTTAHVPVLWRDSEVQAKFETGVQWKEEYEGHLNPVIALAFNETANQLVSTDGEFVHVWSLHSGDCIGKWSTGSRITALTFDIAQRRIITGSDNGKVEMWYYMNGKLLKSFNDCAFEVATILHLELTEGQSVIRVCLASGFSNLVPMWVDRPISTHEVATAVPFNVLNIAFHSADHTHQGEVYAMSYVKPNRLVLGTSVGDVLLFAMNFLSPPQYLSCMASDMFGLLRGVTSTNNRPRIHVIRDSLPVNSKWRRLLEVSEKEHLLSGASEYTNFRVGVQRTLLVVTEKILFLTEELFLTLHGDGEAILWRVFPLQKYKLEVVACFPAAHSSASVALAACIDYDDGILYIGDSNGVLSIFDIRSLLFETRLPSVSKRKSFSARLIQHVNKKSPSGRVYHNNAGVKFSRHVGLPVSSITSMELLKSFNFLVVGSGDCCLILVDVRNGLVMGKFGYDRVSLNTWPVFATGDRSSKWKASAKPPTRGHPELVVGGDALEEEVAANPYSLLPHRFVTIFGTYGLGDGNNEPALGSPITGALTPTPYSNKTLVAQISKTPVPKRQLSLRKMSVTDATSEELPLLVAYYNNVPEPKESIESKLRKVRLRSTILQNRPEPSYRMLATKDPEAIPESWSVVGRKKFEMVEGVE